MNCHPDDDYEDDVEYGELIFDDDDGFFEHEAMLHRQEANADYMSRVDSRGYAPADFIYDPLRKRGFE